MGLLFKIGGSVRDVTAAGGIFVCYRRQEGGHLAGRLYDWLAARFGEDRVFMDVHAIEPGADFAAEIFGAVAACGVLLAIIGPGWLAAPDGQGRRRLDDPGDIVRLEIEAALSGAIRVIPVLVDGAVMPAARDLPDSLAGLARRNAVLVRHDSFPADAGRLIAAVGRVLADGPAAASGPVRGHGPRPGGGPGGGLAQQDPGPAPGSAGRAARLFAEAEDITSAITDEQSRSVGLESLARALAASSPVAAERIAASITGPGARARALRAVAEALAATDPGRAERVAASIADPSQKNEKAGALCAIAKAAGVTDPGRADRLLTEAERIAAPILHANEKAAELCFIARAAAVADPARAERIAVSITRPDWRARALAAVAAAVAAADPGRAGGLLARAEQAAGAVRDRAEKVSVLTALATGVAAADPARAGRLFADAKRTASSIGYPYGQHALVPVLLLEARATADPARADRLLDEAEDAARSDVDEYEAGSALGPVATARAASDPARAERIVESITEEFPKVWAQRKVAEAMAAADPDRAELMAASIRWPLWNILTLSRIATAIAPTDPQRAARLLTQAERTARSLSIDSGKADALTAVAEALAATAR